MTLFTAYKDKNILVLGAGLTGLSCVRLLSAQGLNFAVNDSRQQPFAAQYSEQEFQTKFPTATLSLGQWDSALIANADIILISPGIDSSIAEIAPFIKPQCQVLGDVELFCQLNNQLENPIELLAVTGSNGKSTVVSLLAYLAKSLGVNAQLGGNIGQPVLDVFTQTQTGELAQLPEVIILELSSFQLETLKSMQAIASSVLNISDDHLDRHHTMQNYQAIKQGIYPQSKLAITNRDDKATAVVNTQQTSLSFGSDAPDKDQFGVRFVKEQGQRKAYLAFGEQNLIALDALPLAGMHNALNYLAALALGHSAGWSLAAMVTSLNGFTGLPHRCQRLDSSDDITWINDSKATNVGATLAAINGLAKTLTAQQNLLLIAGGDGKGADFTPLSQPLTEKVSQVITFGKDGDKISNLVTHSIEVNDLTAAVQLAKSKAKAGDIVLLSPACASLDMFKSFVDRGEKFAAAVAKVAEVSA